MSFYKLEEPGKNLTPVLIQLAAVTSMRIKSAGDGSGRYNLHLTLTGGEVTVTYGDETLAANAYTGIANMLLRSPA
jgi:hypothetical protein